MSDIEDNKFVRFSDFDIAQGSQFKEFNYEQEKLLYRSVCIF
ncbi:hypothetical protein [Acinetobacter baumannii]